MTETDLERVVDTTLKCKEPEIRSQRSEVGVIFEPLRRPSEIRFAPHCHEFHRVNKGREDKIFYRIVTIDSINHSTLRVFL